MKDRPRGILVSADPDLYRDLSRRLTAMADIKDRIDDCTLAYTTAKEKEPHLVFLDMSGPRKDLVNLGKRLKKNLPAARIFCIDTQKDPDLILQGFRLGFSDFFHYPFNGTDVEDLVHRAIDPRGAGAGAEVTSVFSLKGGMGVTTLALNLADQIQALTGDRVLLLDLNLFLGDICAYLNIKSAYTPFDFIHDMDRMDKDLLFSSLYQHSKGFYILTTPEEISDSESLSPDQLMDMLSVLRLHFDHIIIDCPHDLSSRTLKVCSASDRVLVLAQQNIPSAKSVQSVVDFFKDLDFARDRLKIVINRYLKTGDMTDDDLEQIFSRKIFFKIENNYPLFTRAANKGLTLDEAAAGSRLNAGIRQLAEKVAGIRAPKPARWKRLFIGRLGR